VGVERLAVEARGRLVARAGDAGGPAAEGARLGIALREAERMGIGPVAADDEHGKPADGGAGIDRKARATGRRGSTLRPARP